MLRPRELEVRDSVFDPDASRTGQKVQYREGKSARYRVFLFLEGNELPYVDSVTYYLHKSFPKPKRVVRRTPSNPRCKLTLWTWGIFDVRAVIEDKKGDEYEVWHGLSYDRELEGLAPAQYQIVAAESGTSPRGKMRRKR